MNSEQYKQFCVQPNVFRLMELTETISVLRDAKVPNIAVLSKALLGNKLEKPPLHKGNHQTDFVVLDLTFEEVDSIVEVLFEAEAFSVQDNGEPSAKTGDYVHLVNQWSKYRDSLV